MFTIHPITDQDLTTYGNAISTHLTRGLAKQRAEEIADRHFYGVCIVDNVTGEVDWGFGANINAMFDDVTEVIPNIADYYARTLN